MLENLKQTTGHFANSVVISYNGFTHLLNGYSQDINQFIVVEQGSNNLTFFQKHKNTFTNRLIQAHEDLLHEESE